MADVKSLIETAQLNAQTRTDLAGAEIYAVCKNGRIYRYISMNVAGPVTVQEIPTADFLAEVTRFLATAPPRKS